MMSAEGSGAYAEHHFRKVIPGHIDAVRQKLSDALEDFNYIVISDNPLQAKRPAQNNAMTAHILEYDTRLTIALKSISPASTLATFDYSVEYLFTKGERLTLEREADAVIALATAPLNKTVCPACETENLGAVRFCRVCGTPMARNKLPAELEVMRLMAGSSAAQIEINTGLLFVFCTLAFTLPFIVLGKPKAVTVGWILFIIGETLGALILLYGLRRLQKTLNPSASSHTEIQPGATHTIRVQEANALASSPEPLALPPQPLSVTEGTTELMSQPQAVAPSQERRRDTDAME